MKLVLTHIFSKGNITVFLHLGTLDSTSALRLWAVLDIEITNEKHKHMKNLSLNGPQKGHLLTV